KVAVVGAGPAGAAFAATLLASARALGRQVELTIFDREGERQVTPPAILDPDSRCRLASLGAAIPGYLRTVELRSVTVWSGGVSEQLPPPTGGLWVVDGAPRGDAGAAILKRSLTMAASLRGARIKAREVHAVERVSDGLVVRASGTADTFDFVAGAFGPQSPLAARWFDDRFRTPGLLHGSHARVSVGANAVTALGDSLYVCFCPTPAVDVLYLVPCGQDAYALAIGEDAAPRDLVEALMLLSRDGVLPGDFELRAVERTVHHAGVAPLLSNGHMAALGGAVQGHPLEPGLLPTLVSAMRTANAVVESAGGERRLQRRLTELHHDLFESARAQHRLLRAVRGAGERVAEALTSVAHLDRVRPGPALGLFGLPYLHPAVCLRSVRRAAWGRRLKRLFGASVRPALPAPATSPLVYVVDDDPDARELLVEYLGNLGLTVRGFGNESAVLEAAARERPAAILMDVVLNWVDGLSLCRALKGHPGTAGVKLISMSGLCRDIDRQAALDSGAEAFFPKPIDLSALEKCLGRFLPLAARQPPEAAVGVTARG
ncbi:MAG: response regulator, partial [Myxococcales bacterium]